MTRTERILIKPASTHYRAVAFICRKAHTLFNCANYLMRQSFINGKILSWMEVDKIINAGIARHPSYQDLPNAMSQAVIKKLGDDWRGYFEALKAYKISPSKFTGKPQMPGYSRSAKTASMPFQHLRCENSAIVFPKKMGLDPIAIHACKHQELKAKGDDRIILEIRFVPQGSCYWLEVVYNNSASSDPLKKQVLLDKKKCLAIDLGINNLATMVFGQPGINPVLVNGRPIKSINQAYNQDMAVLRANGHGRMLSHRSVKRFCQLNDYMHKASHFIIQQCLKHDIGTVVIGHNVGWKQESGMGKVNNQNFTSLPHLSLIRKIQYKAAQYGIDVIVREESYTSKASALDLDSIPTYEKGKNNVIPFSGKRVSRGLYKTATGLLINADVNGALNILRKEVGDSFIKSVANEGLVFRPKRVSFH